MEEIRMDLEIEEVSIDEEVDLLLCCCGCGDEMATK